MLSLLVGNLDLVLKHRLLLLLGSKELSIFFLDIPDGFVAERR